MRSLAALTVFIALACSVQADRFIVKVKDGVDKSPFTKGYKVIYDYEKDIFNGFAADISPDEASALKGKEGVEYIIEDTKVQAYGTLTQGPPAPWNLARLSDSPTLVSPYVYEFDDTMGKDIDVYVLDTGILTTHVEFGGRASWGATFGGYPSADGNGHGTAVAGVVGAKTYGVAKYCNLIAVKVISDSGVGLASDVIAGVQYVITMFRRNQRKTIINISFGGAPNAALDSIVSAAVSYGIVVVVAAGDVNDDVANYSPAGAIPVYTVGASNITDCKTATSNWGKTLDLFAPGEKIETTWSKTNTSVTGISGSSLAAAHVSGQAAVFWTQLGTTAPIVPWAQPNLLCNVPAGTPNLLLYNGY